MSKEVPRRKFLKQSGASSLFALTASSQFSSLSVGQIWEEVEKAGGVVQSSSTVPEGLSDAHRKLLRAVADEIIPAVDGSLAATQAGATDYIETLIGKVPDLQKQAQAALTRLEAMAKARHKQAFDLLSSAQRVKLLQAFEKESARGGPAESLYGAGANLFALLRDLVYEGYYTSPKVWPQLGYEFHPTSRRGPAMQPFDESILAQVRKRPKSYREAQ
ncbi:MAG: gluconate 2-dehydrogenase subunit 3 family protein [Acidobacteria bacterium]|nr:gluconate 2-dehydrogenase subunit 3 family protein [Acidobacteriota bacterium]MCI0524331.1 gluconate 2-dehydrogenase subunit 3 family protein [Acidobacteriota bacterium]